MSKQIVPKETLQPGEQPISGVRFCSLEAPEYEEEKPPVDAAQRAEIVAEVQRLKAAKARAVEEEEFEEAAALKRRIKVLEDTLGEQLQFEEKAAAKERKLREEAAQRAPPKEKPMSQREHGEALWQMPSESVKLVDEEREFIMRSKTAVMRKGVTDDLVNGVPQWAYKDALRDGVQGVKTERPAELQYVFKGQIEDEKWEEGANFQCSIVVQAPVDVAYGYVTAREEEAGEDKIRLAPGSHITHHSSGTAQLTELLPAQTVENEVVVFKVVVVRPKVKGKIKLEAARTVTEKKAFLEKPFYSFKSVWRLRAYPAGGSRITRVVRDFKQFELMDFDALKSVSRAIEVENEVIRQSWSSTVSLAPEKKLAVFQRPGETGVLATQGGVEMYSASFVVEAPVEEVFSAMVSNELLFDYMAYLWDDSLRRLDDSRALIRQVNGMVQLVSYRVKPEQREWMAMVVAHRAGDTANEAGAVTTEKPVLKSPFYRLVNDWIFTEQGPEETLVKRVMRDFKQTGHSEITNVAHTVTEAADEEHRKIIQAFRDRRMRAGKVPKGPKAPEAVSVRANYAMRQMPEILDHAAKNNVLEVREMLEVKGADPNYIHVRRDSWVVSDSRLEFFEEITPLIVAAEHGACEVIKVLFNHPQIDVNLCCCAFSDVDIYNYYTAYDMTMMKKHPHAAALLRARGVLPATSEHVAKPEFDPVHGRPLRETGGIYDDAEDYGEGEMPSWEVISQGNPALAEALHRVADSLSMTKSQSTANRQRIFRSLAADWHPDRHSASGNAEVATKVFQWLQVVKSWYLQESQGPEMEQQPLPGYDDPDRPTAPSGAQQYLHPSGSVFSVW